MLLFFISKYSNMNIKGIHIEMVVYTFMHPSQKIESLPFMARRMYLSKSISVFVSI